MEVAQRLVRAIELLSIDEAVYLVDPEVELTTILEEHLGMPHVHGREGIRLWFERMAEFWASAKVDEWSHEDFGDWLLITGRSRVRGKASPEEFDLPWYAAGHVSQKGLVDVLGLFLTREEALAMVQGDEG